MSSDQNNTKSYEPGAKLDAQANISAGFNQSNELEDQIAAASPEAQQKIRVLQEVRDDRLQEEHKKQQRAHQFRVQRCQVGLLEKYVEDQALRPDEIKKNPAQDLNIIREQSERMVGEREKYYLDNIGKETDRSIQQVLEKDRNGQSLNEPTHQQER